MSSNKNLHSAKVIKNDEFYTELSEIEKELVNYSDKFKGKVVFCNCDDPFESNFTKVFLMNFNRFGLKALYVTGYYISPIVNKEFKVDEKEIPYSLYVTDTSKYLKGDQKDLDINSALKFIQKEKDNIMSELKGDSHYIAGDFRSKESIEILKKCDIVVTNPPFSLFREYIAQLINYNKEFLIIGNKNAVTYKEIFPLLKGNRIWYGVTKPDLFRDVTGNITNKVKGLSRWYTNLDHIERHQILPDKMGHTYKNHEEQYPKYDNYDAINVDKVLSIPNDYYGIMGVPITFLDKYCPEQFEIIGLERYTCPKEVLVGGRLAVNNKSMYARILIRRKDLG